MDSIPTGSPVKPRRSYRRWIVLGLVILMTPVLFLGLAAYSLLVLDRDAAALRGEVMTATGSDWHTKVQVSAGWAALGAVRTGLRFVHHEHIEDARLALAAVRQASVGVYQRDGRDTKISVSQLLSHTDELMRDRGWSRLVGVVDHGQTVLIYTADAGSGNKMDLCLAVLDGQELVVASTRVDAEALAQLVEKHVPDDFRSRLKLAKLGF
jgi:hypothetical protein